MVWSPQVRRLTREGGGERLVVGHWLVDEFLELNRASKKTGAVQCPLPPVRGPA
jgi:hypothetical protein